MENNKPTWTEEEVTEVITQAREWLNTPWRHQGRSAKGVDCIGIFYCISEGMNRMISMPHNYTRDPDQKVLIGYMDKYFDRVPKSEMKRGDLVLMRFVDAKVRVQNRHVALLTENGVIHAAAMFRKVVEHGLDKEWSDRIEYVFRFPRAVDSCQ